MVEEQTFNINTALQKLFLNVKEISKQQHIELIYEMSATVPKEIRGDMDTMISFFTKLLIFVLEHTQQKEVVLYLNAPEDFFYEEKISFRINQSGSLREKIADFIHAMLQPQMEQLGAQIVEDDEGNFQVAIPFRLHELGFRRHYRLSDKSMIEKKVLIVCDSPNVLTSLKEYFEYFHHDVDTGKSDEGFDLTLYDMLLTEDKSVSSNFRHKIIQAYEKSKLKCVWIDEPHVMDEYAFVISAYLQKPITQESIWVLIESLFSDNVSENTLVKSYSMEQKSVVNHELLKEIEVIEIKAANILNIESGDKNCSSIGLKFNNELKKFLEIFDRSDLYFRQIINEKEYDKAHNFCKDVLKRSELIGAESVYKVMETANLVLEHKQYDMLPIYPGKYHAEYVKLKEKIGYFLKG